MDFVDNIDEDDLKQDKNVHNLVKLFKDEYYSESEKKVNDIIKNIKREYVCAIYTNKTNQQVTLPCNHSFCEKCIKEWFMELQNNNKELESPLCRKSV